MYAAENESKEKTKRIAAIIRAGNTILSAGHKMRKRMSLSMASLIVLHSGYSSAAIASRADVRSHRFRGLGPQSFRTAPKSFYGGRVVKGQPYFLNLPHSISDLSLGFSFSAERTLSTCASTKTTFVVPLLRSPLFVP